MNVFKHYLRLNENKCIIKYLSTAFEKSLETDVCINENGGIHFEMFNVINPNIFDKNNIALYKYVDGNIIERTEEDRLNEYNQTPKPKSELEQLKEVVDMLLIDSLGV